MKPQAYTIFLATAVLVAQQALGYPSGAPDQACKDLKPGHGVDPETGKAPFELKQDRQEAGAGEQIIVTLGGESASNTFKGLIVQAVGENGEPVGKFLPTKSKGLKTIDSCSAVTHSDKEAKKTATLVWEAPSDMKKQSISFKGSVVVKFDQIYTNLKSTML